MKKAILALLCLLLIPAAALGAAGVENLLIRGDALCFHYAFDYPREYMVLEYATSKESGTLVITGEEGHFEGTVKLQCTYEPEKVTVKIKNLKLYNIDRGSAQLLQTPKPQPQTTQPTADVKAKKLENLTCTPIVGGVHYAFDAPGWDQIKLKYKSRQEKGEMILYPQENYHYEGDLLTPCTYAKNNVYLDFYPVNRSRKIGSITQKRGYAFAPAPQSPENGPLSGVIVCIDPGHQGQHQTLREPMGPGIKGYYVSKGGMAQGDTTSRLESIAALEYSYLLRDELIKMGAQVVLTREVEETWLSCQERAQIAYDAGAHFMLRIHLNSNSDPQASGIGVYGPRNSDYAKLAASPEEYRAYGEALLEEMKKAAGYELVNKTGVVTMNDRYAGNNWAQMPCFLLELGYMSNPQEDLKLSHPHYQARLVKGIAQGVLRMAELRGLIETP